MGLLNIGLTSLSGGDLWKNIGRSPRTEPCPLFQARLITPSVVSERLKVNGSVAQQAIRHLEDPKGRHKMEFYRFFFFVNRIWIYMAPLFFVCWL